MFHAHLFDVQALNGSDSDSDNNYQQGPAPVLYRMRADGRQVPLTEGHGMNLAYRKGLMQEIIVSPKKATASSIEPNSAFGTHSSSQPESVMLHSVELPQVQLGDREVADSAPEDADQEQKATQHGPHTPALSANPSLLHLQQHQMQQALQPHLVTSSSTHSAPLNNAPHQQGMNRINSLSSLSSEYLRAREHKASNSAAAAEHAQHSAGMAEWGVPPGSIASSGHPGNSSRSYSAHLGHMGQSGGQPHGPVGTGLPTGAVVGGPQVHNSAPLSYADARGMPLVKHVHTPLLDVLQAVAIVGALYKTQTCCGLQISVQFRCMRHLPCITVDSCSTLLLVSIGLCRGMLPVQHDIRAVRLSCGSNTTGRC